MLRDNFLRDMRFAGIQNFPTCGLIAGVFQQDLEAKGMSFQLDVDCVAAARRLDLLTPSYAFAPQQAAELTRAPYDRLMAHTGLTTSGTIGSKTALTSADCLPCIRSMVDAVKELPAEVLIHCHGGPIAMPDDAADKLQRIPAVGVFAGRVRWNGHPPKSP